jgi:lipopolysaccharide/colanic/teichoic acid biosynthesis glycosyltransferase
VTSAQALAKRAFDLFFSALGLACLGWLIVLTYVMASVDTRQSGFFTQQRVGRNGKLFRIVKLRTMVNAPGRDSTVTVRSDPRITRLGRFFRQNKIDELPQLINVLKGDMSFVGPRPDVSGFADSLTGDERLILSVRPGITGPATLHFRNEEKLLDQADNPERFNREVIYPEKVRLNIEYIKNYTFIHDIRIIFRTLFPE